MRIDHFVTPAVFIVVFVCSSSPRGLWKRRRRRSATRGKKKKAENFFVSPLFFFFFLVEQKKECVCVDQKTEGGSFSS